MANNSSNISTPLKGMNTDSHQMNLGEQGYDFALNAVIEEFSGNGFPLLQNESSTLPCINFPEGAKVIGTINIVEQDRKILFLINTTTGISQIGEIHGKSDCDDKLVDKDTTLGHCSDCSGGYYPEANPLEVQTITGCCTYTPIISDICLNFSINHPVRGVYRLNECSVEIYFTDHFNSNRYAEFDYVDDNISNALRLKNKFKLITGLDSENCDVPIYGNVDCNKLLIDPVIQYPCIDNVDLVSGGDLRAGIYQFLFAFVDETGIRRSPYFPATNPIPVFTRYETSDTNYKTDRAVQMTIEHETFRSPYEYYTIAVAQTIDLQTTYKNIGTFPISQTTVLYTGNEKALSDLSIQEIFEQKVYYDTAKYVATSNNYLFWAGMQETKKLNVQRIANNVILNWETLAIPEAVYRKANHTTRFRGYMRDEVYPMGLVLIFETGEESVVGSIPGRASISSDLTVVSNNDVFEDDLCTVASPKAKWQVYNTATVTYTNPDFSTATDCGEGVCYQRGTFSYWQSTDTYPNKPEIYGALCGLPIRHHKFPDSLVTHIHDGLSGTKGYIDGNIVFPIGVAVNHASVVAAIATAVSEGAITQEDADKIIGYRIVRGNRVGHKSVIAKGLMYDVWNYQKDSQTYYYANYPYNDLRNDPFISNSNSGYAGNFNNNSPSGTPMVFAPTKRYTFHSPDTSFNDPQLGNEVKIETEEYGKCETYFNLAEEQAKQKMLSASSYALALAGGIIAMLTAYEPEICTEYTIRADNKSQQQDDKLTQANSQISQATFNAGITGNSTGVWAGLVEGTFTGTITSGSGSIGQHTFSHPDITVAHGEVRNTYNDPYTATFSNTANIPFYNPQTGIDDNFTSTGFDRPDTKMIKTCKGTPKQIKSGQYPSFTSINGALATATNTLILAQNLFNKFSLVLTETNILLDLIKTLVPYKNYGVQVNSIGRYNNYLNIANSGNKRRRIETYAYLKSEKATIDESVPALGTGLSTIFFNNWARESSVYFKTDTTKAAFPSPTTIDNSRYDANSSQDFSNFDKARSYHDISSYYVSLKRFVPDQYGTLNNIEYIDTGHCIYLKNESIPDLCNSVIFGGDIFINRFALKRKMSFFLQTRFMQQNGVDVDYTLLGNVGYPRYFYKTTTGIADSIASGNILDLFTDPWNVLGRPISNLDFKTTKFFYQNGKIYLYNYGIPYFLVESDINVDYRYAENSKEKDFYPHMADLDFWLQEKNVKPTEDNYYFYNRTYSMQNKLHPYGQYSYSFEPGRDCRVNHPNRIIYSNGQRWLTYKANDYYDFPLSNGKLIGVDGIENDKVLVRSENTTQVFNAYVTIPTNADTIAIGNGGMFQSKPQEYAHTTLGYAGSQHSAILHTEFGHIYVDAKRGNIFNLSGQSIDEISKDGMKNWFKENLPFQIAKDFPAIQSEDLDNNFKGIGLALAFDKRFNRFILTKLDYKVIDDAVVYNALTNEFLVGINPVQLTNPKYFCNKSWTISYNFYAKAWTSYHTYTPNYYIDGIDYFMSGLNGVITTLWNHNLTNKSYQVFYGKLQPFIVQTINKPDISKNNINSVEFGLDTIRYHKDFDPFYATNVSFNKAIVFTQNQNSGLLELEYNTKRNLDTLVSYPIVNAKSTTIRVTNSDGIWRFNQFYDIVQSRSNNIPIWSNQCSNSMKSLNNLAFDYQMPDLNKRRIRGEYIKVRLINDVESNYKFIFKFLVNHQVKTFR